MVKGGLWEVRLSIFGYFFECYLLFYFYLYLFLVDFI